MSIYFFFFRPNRSYRVRARYFKPDWPIITEVLRVGLPSLIRNLGASAVVILTNNLLRVTGGDAALSAFAIVNRLSSALITPQAGIAQGMQPLVGYNFGQDQARRVRETIRLSLASAVVYGAVLCGLCLIIPALLIGLLSRDSAVMDEGQTALRLLALAYPLAGVGVVVAAAFQSVGRARDALLLTVGGILVKLPVLLVASALFSLNGIWAAGAASELAVCVVSLVMLKRFFARPERSEALSGPQGEPGPVSLPELRFD
jgi:Na+-driven multidrug efflux pump